jgi:multidrug resistance protein, MATE family
VIVAELRALFRLAAPIAAAQAGLALMGLVDTAVVGRLGAGPLAAVGLGNGIFFALGLSGLGVMMGFDPLFAQALGGKRPHHARKLLGQAGWMALFCTLLLAVPIALLPLGLERAGVAHEVAEGARSFMFWRLPGLFPMYLFAGARSYLQAHGKVRAVVFSTVLANVANLLLDVLFVFGKGPIPAMGAAGSGLATTLCTVLQFAVLAVAARALEVPAASDPAASLDRSAAASERRGPHPGELARVLKIGLPVGLQMAAETGVFALVGLLAARLGKDQMAAHQVALALASFTFCFAVGVGAAGSVRVGWAVGAQNQHAVRLRGLCAFAGGAGIMSISALLFWLFPAAIARTISDRPDVVKASVPLLAVTAAFQIADGVQAVGAGVLRGAGDTRIPLVANLVGHWTIGLPVALWLGYGLGLGVIGLWWGLCAGLSAVAATLLLRFLRLSSRPIAPL